jgi:hypothetical protein
MARGMEIEVAATGLSAVVGMAMEVGASGRSTVMEMEMEVAASGVSAVMGMAMEVAASGLFKHPGKFHLGVLLQSNLLLAQDNHETIEHKKILFLGFSLA